MRTISMTLDEYREDKNNAFFKGHRAAIYDSIRILKRNGMPQEQLKDFIIQLCEENEDFDLQSELLRYFKL